MALALLLDPELRLRVCHLEDILKAKQLHARQQVRQWSSGTIFCVDTTATCFLAIGPPASLPLHLRLACARSVCRIQGCISCGRVQTRVLEELRHLPVRYGHYYSASACHRPHMQSATGSGSSTTTAGSQGHNNGECDAAQASQARGGSPPLPPLVQLQTALADPSFAALFELDPCITEPDWGMQVRLCAMPLHGRASANQPASRVVCMTWFRLALLCLERVTAGIGFWTIRCQ